MIGADLKHWGVLQGYSKECELEEGIEQWAKRGIQSNNLHLLKGQGYRGLPPVTCTHIGLGKNSVISLADRLDPFGSESRFAYTRSHEIKKLVIGGAAV